MADRPCGSYVKYKKDRCRCTDCRQAARHYEKSRLVRKARGLQPYVDAGKARDHIAWLNSPAVRGEVASLAGRRGTVAEWWFTPAARRLGLMPTQLKQIGSGQIRRIRASTGRKIVSLTPNSHGDGLLVDAAPTKALIVMLLERGWTKAAIARAIGVSGARMLQIARSDKVRRVTADAVHQLALSGLTPPPRPQRQRDEQGRFTPAPMSGASGPMSADEQEASRVTRTDHGAAGTPRQASGSRHTARSGHSQAAVQAIHQESAA